MREIRRKFFKFSNTVVIHVINELYLLKIRLCLQNYIYLQYAGGRKRNTWKEGLL